MPRSKAKQRKSYAGVRCQAVRKTESRSVSPVEGQAGSLQPLLIRGRAPARQGKSALICRKKETAAEVLQCRKTKMPSIARPSIFGMRCGRLARSLCKTELRSLLDKQSQNPFSFPAQAPGKIAPTSWICWLERVSRAEACMTGAGNIQRIVAFVALELM